MMEVTKLIAKLTTLPLNVAREDTNAQTVPVSIVRNSAMVPGTVAMDPMNTIARADHQSSPVAMGNVFPTTLYATNIQIAEINRMREIVLAPGESSGVTPESVFLLLEDAI